MTPDQDSGRRAVFLDRDGVINEAIVRDGKPFSPRAPEDLVMIPGISEACRTLSQQGFAVVVVTNQPDVARGMQTAEGLATIHTLLRRHVAVDAIYFCPHDNADECMCRKPKPGMLLDAAKDLSLDLRRSFMVGDRWSDIEAGHRAGCTTIFVDHGYDDRRPDAPDHTAPNSVQALDWILHHS